MSHKDSGHAIVLYALSGILAVALFLRGLWFPRERYVFYIALFLLGLAWLVPSLLKRDRARSLGPLASAMLVLLSLYGGGMIWGLDRRAALDAFLSHTAYAAVFFVLLGSAGAVASSDRGRLLDAFRLVGGSVAIASLGMLLGLIPFPGSLFGIRLGGPLQSPNVLGSLMASAALLLPVMGPGALGWRGGLFRAFAVLESMVLWATSSRGAFLSLLAAGVVVAFVLFRSVPRQDLYRALWTLAAGLAGGVGLVAALEADLRWLGVLIVLISLCAGGVWPLPALPPATVTPGRRPILVWVPALALVVLTASAVRLASARQAGMLQVFAETAPAIDSGGGIPDPSSGAGTGTGVLGLDRFRGGASGDMSFRSRFVYAGDTVRMVLDRPWLGGGGGAWEVLYTRYQSYGYVTRSAHNQYLQAAAEIGVAGFLIWIGGLLWILRFLWRTRGYPPVEATGRAGAGAAALVLLTHSWVDVALMIPAVSLWFWALAGWCQGVDGEGSRPGSWLDQGARLTVMACLIVGLGVLPALLRAQGLGVLAERLDAGGDAVQALQAYVSAEATDPWNSDWVARRAVLLARTGRSREAEQSLALAASMVPTVEYRVLLAQLTEARGDTAALETAAAHWEQCLELAPFRTACWEHLAAVRARLAAARFGAGDREGATVLAEGVLSLLKKMETRGRTAPAWGPAEKRLAGESSLLLWSRCQALFILEKTGSPMAVSPSEPVCQAGRAGTIPPAGNGEPLPPVAGVLVRFSEESSPAARAGAARMAGAVAVRPVRPETGWYEFRLRKGMGLDAVLTYLQMDPHVAGVRSQAGGFPPSR